MLDKQPSQVPNHRSVLSFNYITGETFNSYIRLNYYNGWESTGGLFGPRYASVASSYGSSTLVDGEESALTSPFEFNAGFWYVRAPASI